MIASIGESSGVSLLRKLRVGLQRLAHIVVFGQQGLRFIARVGQADMGTARRVVPQPDAAGRRRACNAEPCDAVECGGWNGEQRLGRGRARVEGQAFGSDGCAFSCLRDDIRGHAGKGERPHHRHPCALGGGVGGRDGEGVLRPRDANLGRSLDGKTARERGGAVMVEAVGRPHDPAGVKLGLVEFLERRWAVGQPWRGPRIAEKLARRLGVQRLGWIARHFAWGGEQYMQRSAILR